MIMVEARIMHLPDEGDQHHHSHHQVVVGLSGEADIDVDGKGTHLDASRACVLPTEVAHAFRGDARNHVLVINFDEQLSAFCQPAHPDYDFLHRFFDRPRQLTLDNTLQSLVRCCSAEFVRRENDLAIHDYLATGIVRCMGSAFLEPSSGRPQPRALAVAIDIDAIDRYIDANLHRPVSVEDLASCVCMSRSLFHDRFRDSMGLTPHQYLIRARLKRARFLISETGLPLWDISQRAGFSSQSALTNAMQKYLEITPSTLRRRRQSPVS